MKNITSYTPGPWKVHYDTKLPDGTETESITAGTIFRHFVCHCEGDNRKANARLIAAAPELLEILTDVGQWLELALENGQINRGTANRDGDLVTQIRAVIAKAKGGDK